MDQKKKYSPLRVMLALSAGMVIACLLNVIDNHLNTNLYENYNTIAYVLVPLILAGCLVATLWTYVKNRKQKAE